MHSDVVTLPLIVPSLTRSLVLAIDLRHFPTPIQLSGYSGSASQEDSAVGLALNIALW